jgi:MFS transporter, AAHS family, 4-hydroxybenzoate transporter
VFVARSPVSVTSIDAPLSANHGVRVLVLAMISAMFDGFYGQAIAFVSPAIAKDWNLPTSAFGPIFSIGLVGLVIGAVVIAPLGDRTNRRAVAILAASAIAAFTLGTALVRSPSQLAGIRLLTGIGLGTLMPILVTITNAAAPEGRKGLFVTLLVTAFPFGSFAGGMLATWCLQRGTWHDVFIYSGLLAAAFPLLFWLFLWAGPPARGPGHVNGGSVTVFSLFRDRRSFGTTCLWVVFFASLLNTYMLGAWLPLLLERGGMPSVQAIRIAAEFSLGGTIGGLVLGLCASRFGPWVLAGAYLAGAVALLGIAFVGSAYLPVLLLTIFVGAMIPGGNVGNNVFAARFYPDAMNATGVGWAQGLGRVGCVTGPALVGVAVAKGMSNPGIFAFSAVCAVVGSLAAVGLAVIRISQPATALNRL